MSRECIQNCWRIQHVLEQMDTDDMLAGPLAIHPDFFSGDDNNASRLLRLCEATYDCQSGPGETEVDIVKGFIRKRTETEVRPTCGLPDEYFER